MRDLILLNKLTSAWKNRQQLVDEAGNLNGVGFHPVQNISCFKSITLNIAKETNNNLIICAFDSLDYHHFTLGFGKIARKILPVTSTIPSTSMTAWTSIFRGSEPSLHGVYGTAFHIRELGKTISFLSRRFREDSVTDIEPHFTWLSENAGSTLFNDLSSLGYASSFYGLGNHLTELSFFNQISAGARLIDMPNGEQLEFDLNGYANYLLNAIEHTIAEHAISQQPFCCVAFMSCARYIADYGYDDRLVKMVTSFAGKIKSIQDRFDNLSIVAVSDHGMIKQQPTLDIPLIEDTNVLQLSKHKPGGAGRILFFYPKEECFSSMWNLLENRIGNSGRLFSRDQYIQQFYNTSVYQPDRIGEIVAVAHNEEFPSAGLHDAYEHGGLSEDEMISFIGLI